MHKKQNHLYRSLSDRDELCLFCSVYNKKEGKRFFGLRVCGMCFILRNLQTHKPRTRNLSRPSPIYYLSTSPTRHLNFLYYFCPPKFYSFFKFNTNGFTMWHSRTAECG